MGAPQSGQELPQAVRDVLTAGKSVVMVTAGSKFMGALTVADSIRPSTMPALERIRRYKIDINMMTGDSEEAAAQASKDLGLRTYTSRATPQQKYEEVRREQSLGKVVGMVGDGINDAPALSAADVSFAVRSGSDVAIESADIVLMRSDLQSIADTLSLSQATLRKMRQNLFLAFVYNSASIPIAAMGLLSPTIAGAAMALSSVSVVVNALLLKRWQKPRQR